MNSTMCSNSRQMFFTTTNWKNVFDFLGDDATITVLREHYQQLSCDSWNVVQHIRSDNLTLRNLCLRTPEGYYIHDQHTVEPYDNTLSRSGFPIISKPDQASWSTIRLQWRAHPNCRVDLMNGVPGWYPILVYVDPTSVPDEIGEYLQPAEHPVNRFAIDRKDIPPVCIKIPDEVAEFVVDRICENKQSKDDGQACKSAMALLPFRFTSRIPRDPTAGGVCGFMKHVLAEHSGVTS